MNRLELHISNPNQDIVPPLTPPSSSSTLGSSSARASHSSQIHPFPLPKRGYICNSFLLILIMRLELMLLFSCYFSVIHAVSLTYALTLPTAERARTKERALYLEWTKGKLEAICHAFLGEFILLLWKVNLPPAGFYCGKFHCTTEMTPLMTLFILELHIRSQPFANLQWQFESNFSRSPPSVEFTQGPLGTASGRTQSSPSQEFRRQAVSGQYRLQNTFIQKVRIHLCPNQGLEVCEHQTKHQEPH